MDGSGLCVGNGVEIVYVDIRDELFVRVVLGY